MSVRQLSPELARLAKVELGEDPAKISSDLLYIKDWLNKQPHITARMDDQWLLAFLRGCKHSLERTKEKLDKYYTMKSTIPEISIALDPSDYRIIEMLRLGTCVPLPKSIGPDGSRVMLIRPGVYDPSKFTLLDSMRLCHMITEIQMLEDDNAIIAGQRYIVDLKITDIGHFSQMTPATIKLMVLASQEVLPIRLKGSHCINFHPTVEIFFSIFKRFMSEKNKQRIFIHSDDSTSLHEYVPKEILPSEYGGDAGPILDMTEYWEKKLISYKDWFMEESQFKTDETLRPGKSKGLDVIFGTGGSFRQLAVD